MQNIQLGMFVFAIDNNGSWLRINIHLGTNIQYEI